MFVDERQLDRHEGKAVGQDFRAEQHRRDQPETRHHLVGADRRVKRQNVHGDAGRRSAARVASGVFMFFSGTPS